MILTPLTAAVIAAAVVLAFLLTPQSSSAIEPPGATLYENINFNRNFNEGPTGPGGRELVVTGNIACLHDPLFDFDNIASSLN